MGPRPHITVWWSDGAWHALSSDPHQGGVAGTAEIVLKVVAEWMADAPTG